TLMAYDLWNEPASVWPEDTIGHSKQDVCEKVKMWYDTVKAGDPHHLVTMGGQGHHDILEYDHAVMTLDFYSPHLYPDARQYEGPTYFESLMNSFYGKLYWVSNNCKMPWIIGETGFRAIENSVFSTNYDGTLSDQYDFADSATMKTWECGGSGFSWWFYQDVCNDGYGILKQNQACTNWPCSTILKPVWEVFDDFTPPATGACSEPPYYYDPFYHGKYSPKTNIVTGYVLDREDNPIKDAVIFAHTRLYNAQNPQDPPITYDMHYTFTDEDGFFTVIPYDYDTAYPNFNTIEGLTISAAVCSRLREWCEPDSASVGVDSGQTYRLDRFDLNYEESFESLTIAGNEPVVLQAWDLVSLTDVEVQQNATCEVKARIEISVNQEFTAANGSETWIHTGTPFIPCDSLSSFTESSFGFFMENELDKHEIAKEITLNFTPVQGSFDVLIYPNPGRGLFTIDVQCSSPLDNLTLSVYDTFGKTVYSSIIQGHKSQLDLAHLSKGFYIIQISNIDYQTVKKIIIQ
ncbi:MAG: T9SS type A sorting domain-containing protein, partial [Bacteroidota bacterium]